MVYRGRLSRGCELCRKRKIRCDTQRPECGQCIKHNAICPGYRELDGRIFEDQTEEIRAKADRKNRRDRSNLTTTSTLTLRSDPSPKATLSSIQLSQSVDACAMNYFYFNYIAPTYLNLFPDRDTFEDTDTVMGASVQSAALAGFAHRLGSPEDVQYARRRYARALLLANEALQDPKNGGMPDLLVAIHFLAIFENIDCDQKERMTSWQTHTKGNLALLRQMSRQDLLHPHTLAVFNHMRPLVLNSFMWTQTPVPQYFIDAVDYTHGFVTTHRPLERLSHIFFKIAIEFLSFRADMRSGKVTEASFIITKCQDLDERLAVWYNNATESDEAWKVETISDPYANPTEVWNGTYHIYTSYPASTLWCFYYCIRSILSFTCELHLRRLNEGRLTEENLRLIKLVGELFENICASVPCRLGFGQEGSPLACGGFGIMFYLFYVGESILSIIRKGRDQCDIEVELASLAEKPEAKRKFCRSRKLRQQQVLWVIGRLEYITQCVGVHQARVFAKILRKELDYTCDRETGLCISAPWRDEQSMQECTMSVRYLQAPLPCQSPTESEMDTAVASIDHFLNRQQLYEQGKISWNEYFARNHQRLNT